MKFYTKFQHEKSKGINFSEPSLTQQSFLPECDINNIVNGIAQTELKNNPPQFGVTFKPGQYEEALNVIADAKSQFEELPSNIRAKFDNNPKKLLEFIDEPKNYEECVQMGIFNGTLMDKFKDYFETVKNNSKPTSENIEVTEVSSQ